MATKKTTIQKTTCGSTSSFALKWTLCKPTSGGYIDVKHLPATGKVILIYSFAGSMATDNYMYVGSSSTADSADTNLLNSAGKLGPMKILMATGTDTSWGLDSAFGASGEHSFTVVGPFETARVADTDGYIKYANWTSGDSYARVAAIFIN